MKTPTLLLPAVALLSAGFFGTALAQRSPHGALSMDCMDCHLTDSWQELSPSMRFDHATTGFVLYGQHRLAACKACHTTLRFSGTARTCNACHFEEYDKAAAIDHRAAGFSMDCTSCHREEALSWRDSFDHDKSRFPIRGIHQAVACAACHTGGRFRGTPSACVACHLREYQTSTNPNHAVAGFSTECATCHRALTWQPATFFPHSYFPIGKGDRHSPGVWNSCADCHLAQPNYKSFECIFCHQHTQAQTNPRHAGVSGYQYKSALCYQCHSSP